VLGVTSRAAVGMQFDALAILGHDARPPLVPGAQALEEPLQVGSCPGRVPGQGQVPVAVPALPAPLRPVETR
jgi:hypothetical protein